MTKTNAIFQLLESVTFEELRALQDLMELWDKINPEEEGWTFTSSGVNNA